MSLEDPRAEQDLARPQEAENERLFASFALAIFIVLTVILAAYHEPWRDEAEAWLIVRDESLGEVFHRANYAGTPILWNLLQAPFAKAGAPYTTQRYLHLLIATSATGLLLFRAPFPSSCGSRLLSAISSRSTMR